jgi:pSer/pThr/pTyr-binding forkhead associated (FHA) protein
MNFQPSKSSIRIGRSENCEVVINEIMFSRFQCIIDYNENVGWTIIDGYTVKTIENVIEYRHSTNGTW